IVFDLLVWDGEAGWKRPFSERRAELERVGRAFQLSPRPRAASSAGAVPPACELSPCTGEAAGARAWLEQFEALGLDGVVAKRLDVPYLPGSRDGMVKVKEHKTADCVVIGVRWKGEREAIATLLLGLYREDGGLDYVGSCAVAAKTRPDVAAKLLPLVEEDPEWHSS